MDESILDKMLWSKQFDTGIEEVDNQHKSIVALVNKMKTTIEKKDREQVGEVLREMIDYAGSHFAFEEQLMEESSYRFLGAHKKVHELFVRKVLEYQDRFKAGEDIAIEIYQTLVHWLINHISREDQGYVSAIQDYYKQQLNPSSAASDEEPKEGWFSRLLRFLMIK